MRTSRWERQNGATEDVGGELLLSFGLLEGLLPIAGSEFEDALARPSAHEAEQVAGNRLTDHVVAACGRPCSGRRPERAPAVGEQRVEFIVGRSVVHAREDVGEVLGGLDAVSDA